MRKEIKVSLVLNIIIAVFTLIASIMMFTGLRFSSMDLALETTKLGMFKFFTVDSNLLAGIASLVFIIYEIKLLGGSIKEIPKGVYILKYMATVAVSLTFFVVFTYLGPINQNGPLYGIWIMIQNSNLFFHLLIPILCIITFVLFERTDKIKFKEVFLGLVPMLLYSIFYMTNVFVHMEKGIVSPKYDFYWFVQNGVWTSVIVVPLIIFITFGLSALLWKFNKRG